MRADNYKMEEEEEEDSTDNEFLRAWESASVVFNFIFITVLGISVHAETVKSTGRSAFAWLKHAQALEL